jgi:hypothetical protein
MKTYTKTLVKLVLLALVSSSALAMEAQQSDLHIAARWAGTEEVASILFDKPAAVNVRDAQGNTALHEAASHGRLENAGILLELGADVNMRNNAQKTALTLAREAGHNDLAGLLLAYGASERAPQPAASTRPAPIRQPAPATVPANRRSGIAPCLFERNQLLFLPGITGGALRAPGVYHVYSRARVAAKQRWACAFHALDNMRTLEGLIGNRIISDQVYIDACSQIARRPGHSSSNIEQSNIAKRMGLMHMINLRINDGDAAPEILFDTGTSYTFYDNEDPDTVGELAEQTRQEQEWQRLRGIFAQSRGPICMHFCASLMCYTDEDPENGESHGITVSVTKNVDGDVATYIFDNMNEAENSVSQESIRRHVEFIRHKLLG